jgi:hypothetical protein
MIPREILRKIRQIEIRTNRVVTGFAVGARASARFIARTTAASNTDLPLGSIRTLKRRECRAPVAPERGCVRSTSRSTPDTSYALTNHHALRLGLRPQPRSNSCRAQGLEFRVYAARFASVPIRLKAELQTVTIFRCPSRITHHASRHP